MDVAILGAGKVGITIATILQNCRFCREIRIADLRAAPDQPMPAQVRYQSVDFTDTNALRSLIAGSDAVIVPRKISLTST